VKKVAALLCFLGLSVAGFFWSSSRLGFLVSGLAPALLLDRYTFRLLPWRGDIVWRRELIIRAGWAAGGTGFFYLLRFGNVPWSEAFFLGIGLSLGALLVESIIALTARRTEWRVMP
jgi:hypothetical protein